MAKVRAVVELDYSGPSANIITPDDVSRMICEALEDDFDFPSVTSVQIIR